MRKFCVIASYLLVALPAWATHIVGGEITYRCLGNNRYEINMVVYRDCFYGNPLAWFDDPASIGVFNASNALVRDIRLRPLGNDTLQPMLTSKCLVIPPSVCVHTTAYRDTVELPPSPGGYTLAYQRCCRNQTIVNIVNPLATGATFLVVISEMALNLCNSSPTFNDWPPIYICAGEPIMFDHSATDADGDSIVYRLCTPLQGANQIVPQPQPPNPPPYLPVSWVSPPYGVNNMLNGTPGDPTLAIHPVTGLMTGLPNTVGQFVVGVCAEEYRNGQLIGTLRRDFQYNVGICSRTTSAFFAPEVQCGNLTVFFENQSLNASDFIWYFNDLRQPGAASTEVSPYFTFSDTGRYTIMLIANPGTSCADTAYREITLLPNSIIPDMDISLGPCSDSVQVYAIDLSYDTLSTIVRRRWWITDPPLEGDSVSVVLNRSGTYSFVVELTADNGCVLTYEEPVEVRLIDAQGPFPVTICQGDTTSLIVRNLSNQVLSYNWAPAQDIVSGQGTNLLRVSPPTSTTYRVTVQSSAGCIKVYEALVTVRPPVSNFMATATPDTISPGESSQLNATFYSDEYTYTWFPAGNLSDARIHNPVATPLETTTYFVRLRSPEGCFSLASVMVVVREAVCDWPNIYVPNGFTPNNDGRNDVLYVRGNNIDELYFVIYNRWGEKVFESRSVDVGWDGSQDGRLLPSEVYGYYLRVRCRNGQEFFGKGNITLIR